MSQNYFEDAIPPLLESGLKKIAPPQRATTFHAAMGESLFHVPGKAEKAIEEFKP